MFRARRRQGTAIGAVLGGFVTVAAAAGLALAATPARAEIAALVIGIDRYTKVNPLQGAVNDARDIADALKGLGVKKLRLFIDGEAERSRIIAAWRQLIAETSPDSTLVLTFAGHGAQQPERVPGSEADGMDEFLVLADFAPRGPGTAQRLTDDEIAVLLKEAAPRRVIFVSDSCHSGTMTRAFDDRAGMLGTRAAKIDGVPIDHIEDDALPLPTRAALQAEAEEQPNVTFFAAVADHELAPEVMIDRKPRGALSWAFANALRGQADRDGDGIVTKGELEAHIRGAVRMALEGRQHPQVQPRGRGEIPLIDPVAGQPKPGQRVLAFVLVVQAVDGHHAGLGELHEHRVLVAAGFTPRSPDVEHPHPAQQILPAQGLAGVGQQRQVEGRGGFADERRGHLARVAVQADGQEDRQRQKKDQRQQKTLHAATPWASAACAAALFWRAR